MTHGATVDILERLIAFDTTTHLSNIEMADWCRAHLEACGARVRQDWSLAGDKVNLFATFGEGEGGLCLSGHMDVVSVEGQAWSSDPFRADIRDAKLYGRGACDMKGFVASMLARAPALGQRKAGKPVHMALTYDEEQVCRGVPFLIEDLRRAGIMPSGCVVGEPTSMRLVTGHKGGRVYRAHITGASAHSSLAPHAVNAIETAARLATFISDLAAREAKSGARAVGFDVPHATISCNLIEGGSGPNIVPLSCSFLFDMRVLPGTSADMFFNEIETFVHEVLIPQSRRGSLQADILFENLGDVPALDEAPHSEIHRAVQALYPGNPFKVAFGTEAGFFQRYGVPSVVIGPGSIEQAHKPDEFVPLDELSECDRMLTQLIARFDAHG